MKKFLLAASALLLALQSSAAPAATTHDNKVVYDMLEDSRACVFFRLNGVTVANSAVNTDPDTQDWFAIPRDHPGFHDLFAMLLTARILQLPVRVITTDTASCGTIAGVNQIYIKN